MKNINKILICAICGTLLCSCSNKDEYSAPIVEYRPRSVSHSQNLYTVQDGDTIGTIASKLGVTRAELIKKNNLMPPYELLQGQKLLIPPKLVDADELNALPHKVSDKSTTSNIAIVQEGGLKTEYDSENRQQTNLPSMSSTTAQSREQTQLDDDLLVESSVSQLSDSQELKRTDTGTKEDLQELKSSKYVWPVASGRTRISKKFDNASGHVLITTPGRTPVKTIADGIVKMAGKPNSEQLARFGNMIVIQHKELSKVSIYANVIDLKVKNGQTVSAGDTIALVGQKGIRGMTENPALYFEIDKTAKGKKRQPIDPCTVLP